MIRSFLFLSLILLVAGCEKQPAEPPQPSNGAYADGEARVAKECASGLKPVNIIVMGDGFVKEDYEKDGAFDQAANRALSGLFSTEPYKTYNAYFRVQKVAAYSQERGASVTSTGKKAKTVFSVTLEGGGSTGISGEDKHATVWRYAKKAQGITDAELTRTTVIVISNYAYYAGTTFSYGDGKSVAYITLSEGVSQMKKFENVVVHEAGGHGFGQLHDEYYKPNSGNINNDQEALEELIYFQSLGFDQNVSLTSDRAKCPWNFIFSLSQYQSEYKVVSTIEGGALFAQGVWRPEPISCMEDNRPYFNAPSRIAIVKRIMKIAGATFSIQDFISKDVDRFKVPQVNQAMVKSSADDGLVRLAPPVRIRE